MANCKAEVFNEPETINPTAAALFVQTPAVSAISPASSNGLASPRDAAQAAGVFSGS